MYCSAACNRVLYCCSESLEQRSSLCCHCRSPAGGPAWVLGSGQGYLGFGYQKLSVYMTIQIMTIQIFGLIKFFRLSKRLILYFNRLISNDSDPEHAQCTARVYVS